MKKPTADFLGRGILNSSDDGVMAVICPTRQIVFAALELLPHKELRAKWASLLARGRVDYSRASLEAQLQPRELAVTAGVEVGPIFLAC